MFWRLRLDGLSELSNPKKIQAILQPISRITPPFAQIIVNQGHGHQNQRTC
ncbi:hypothetical protein NEIMUCOT_04884 [Neisseria mucosa ATCC 25996]|uniref:Uncharacterized protein n=1 Tax=Neisseria mucosa (strain ATCC 25996 / DSM 4631 / NCTC 10774 / M26) TaxID=546266 RepID=D2ZW91_NEIM2|nr:hypothetical protein NEIMUCOT_04884 [Neisseria mucosa ATCC 25996]